jgi:hypothetical protein
VVRSQKRNEISTKRSKPEKTKRKGPAKTEATEKQFMSAKDKANLIMMMMMMTMAAALKVITTGSEDSDLGTFKDICALCAKERAGKEMWCLCTLCSLWAHVDCSR